jgi:sporulation protein YlmC with PRC-barrel domain
MKETTEKPIAMYGSVRASKIIGETVVNRQSENMGKILDLVIDAKNNRVTYAVLDFGGFLGIGNKLFAIPWGAFEFSGIENKLIINVDKEKLTNAPGFDENEEWPDFSDTLWGECIYNYYDFTPPWREDHECGCEASRPIGHTSCCSINK